MAKQADLFESLPNEQQQMRFDGCTYNHERDGVRLKGQMLRVYSCLCERRWWTLAELSKATGDPEASISARIRDLRKDRFGAHDVEVEYVRRGLHRYRLRLTGYESSDRVRQ